MKKRENLGRYRRPKSRQKARSGKQGRNSSAPPRKNRVETQARRQEGSRRDWHGLNRVQLAFARIELISPAVPRRGFALTRLTPRQGELEGGASFGQHALVPRDGLDDDQGRATLLGDLDTLACAPPISGGNRGHQCREPIPDARNYLVTVCAWCCLSSEIRVKPALRGTGPSCRRACPFSERTPTCVTAT